MRTKLADELGLEFPVFAFTHCRDVAAAVSKAGGLGVLGVAAHSLENLDAKQLVKLLGFSSKLAGPLPLTLGFELCEELPRGRVVG